MEAYESQFIREAVTRGIDDLFAAFHQRPPAASTYELLGRTAEELGMTADAVEAAFADMRTRTQMPKNLEVDLRDAWRKWLEAGGSSIFEGNGCPDCGGTGWIFAWRPNAGAGEGPVAVPCACGAAGEQIEGLTGGIVAHKASDLSAKGWSFSWTKPEKARGVNRSAVKASILAAAQKAAPPQPQSFQTDEGFQFGDASQYPF